MTNRSSDLSAAQGPSAVLVVKDDVLTSRVDDEHKVLKLAKAMKRDSLQRYNSARAVCTVISRHHANTCKESMAYLVQNNWHA